MKKFTKALLIVMVLALCFSALAITASATDTVVTNSQLYIGEYESATHAGMAHIVFGTVSNHSAEYGVIIEQVDGKRFKFQGKNIGESGKFGIAIYDLPEGTYKAQAYSGEADSRILGEQTTFTMGKATYTVTLDYNGATGYDSNEILVAQGSKLEEIDMTNVTLAGGEFVEWQDANGDAYDFNTVLTSDIALSAIYESKYGGEMNKAYITTGAQSFGVNQNVNVGFGGTIVWQFDVAAYENASSAIRMVVSNLPSSNASYMAAYKPAIGGAASVMGFTAANGQDWYGGTYGKSGNKSTVFKADYSYKLEYVAPTAQYATDGSFKLYECETALVGTANESWSNTFYLKDMGNVEGGNQFCPVTCVNLNVYFGGAGVKFATLNNKLVVNGTPYEATMEYTGTCDWDYVPYVIYGTSKKITMTGDSAWGHIVNGVSPGYGGKMTMQFDVLSANIGSRWSFAVTNVGAGAVATTPATIRTYKDPYQGQILGYASTGSGVATAIVDWYGGTPTTSRRATTAFVAGNTYKFEYVAATGETSADGTVALYECPTAFIGTPLEAWTEILASKGFDNSGATNGFSPVTDVQIGLWTNGSVELEVDNAKVVAYNAAGTVIEEAIPDDFCGGASFEKVEYVAPDTTTTATWTNTGIFGFAENGIDVDYGESLTWQFDVLEYSAPGWLGFCVTSNDVKSNYADALSYKTGYCSNRFVFTTTAYDWLSGTQTFKRNATNCLRVGYTYKLVYNAPSAADQNDGSFYLYECEPGTLGAANEAWNLCASLVNFGNNNGNGNSFAPTENVKFIMYAQNGNPMKLKIDNSKITCPDGSSLDGPYYGYNCEIA